MAKIMNIPHTMSVTVGDTTHVLRPDKNGQVRITSRGIVRAVTEMLLEMQKAPESKPQPSKK